MWFDVQAALAEIEGGEPPPSESRETLPRVAHVAHVVRPRPGKSGTSGGAGAGQLHPDAAELADLLRLRGPTTYGAAASTLSWGAARAWQAEARLRAAGMVRLDKLGRAELLADELPLKP